jgi:hypothetical protein
MPVETLALAAGTLSTSRIFLSSIQRKRGNPAALEGLMDNRQVLMPFVNLSLVGRAYEPRSYQYHQLAIALKEAGEPSYVHALVTALTTAPAHPIIATMPLDLRTAVLTFRNGDRIAGSISRMLRTQGDLQCRPSPTTHRRTSGRVYAGPFEG